jgi:hypothetical protein
MMAGKSADGGQRGSLCLSHGSGRVRRRLLGRQPFHQCPRLLIGADRRHI